MVAALTVAKKTEPKAAEQGIKLAPDEKELRRWYTERRSHEVPQDDDEDDNGKRYVGLKNLQTLRLTRITASGRHNENTSTILSQPLNNG